MERSKNELSLCKDGFQGQEGQKYCKAEAYKKEVVAKAEGVYDGKNAKAVTQERMYYGVLADIEK